MTSKKAVAKSSAMPSEALPHSTPSMRQILSYIVLVVAVLVLGIMVGSLSSVGRTVRSVVYGGRGEIDLAVVQEIYGILQQDFDGTLDNQSLQNGAKAGLVTATGDPFANYLTPQETTVLMQRMRGNGFVGIGVELGFKDNKLVIIAPHDGSPAAQAGIQAGDAVIAIDGVLVSTMSEEEAIQALRGERGSQVQLTVQRGGQRLDFTITRQPITIPSVRSSVTSEGIGVLTVTTFDNNTGRLARAAAETFVSSNVSGVVLDLRNNPGGAVTAAQELASLWLPEGSVVMTERRGQTTLRTYRTAASPLLDAVPTIILLNGNSASASEVVAGALSESGKATIIGTQSFGKGSVQEVRPLSNGGSLIFTVSRWFTPKNNSIDGRGITPDTIVESSATSTGNDTQLNAALTKLASL